MYDGIVRILECRHVPEMKRNLISLSLLDSHDYEFSSRSGVLKVFRGALVMMKGKLDNGLYYL